MTQQSRWTIGVDIGGTNTKLGLVDLENGEILISHRIPTAIDRRQLLSSLIDSIKNLANQSPEPICGCGIGCPGPIDAKQGLVLNPLNVKALWNTPLVKLVVQATSLPTLLANDSDCYTLSEALYGAAKEADSVLGVTLGTGIGTGFVIKRQIWQGHHGMAAELWRNPYRQGILNDYLSAEATARINDEEFGLRLAEGLAAAINIIDPEVVVIGGGRANHYEQFLPSLREHIQPLLIPQVADSLEIRRAKFMSGISGAAGLFKPLRVPTHEQEKIYQ